MAVKVTRITKAERDKIKEQKFSDLREAAAANPAKVVHEPPDIDVLLVEQPPKPEPVFFKGIEEAHQKIKEATWRRPSSEWLQLKKSEYVNQLTKQET